MRTHQANAIPGTPAKISNLIYKHTKVDLVCNDPKMGSVLLYFYIYVFRLLYFAIYLHRSIYMYLDMLLFLSRHGIGLGMQ